MTNSCTTLFLAKAKDSNIDSVHLWSSASLSPLSLSEVSWWSYPPLLQRSWHRHLRATFPSVQTQRNDPVWSGCEFAFFSFALLRSSMKHVCVQLFLWKNPWFLISDCVVCASDLCQRHPADAVLVLQRHQHGRLRSLVQETQRGAGLHVGQRRRPGHRVRADREQPDGEWKSPKQLSFYFNL